MSDTLVVTLAILAVFLIISVVAMIKFPAKTFFKFWAAFGPIFGGVAGTIATYYYQQGEVKKARDTTSEVVQTLTTTQGRYDQMERNVAELQRSLSAAPSSGQVGAVSDGLKAIRTTLQTEKGRVNSTLKRVPPEVLRKVIQPRTTTSP